MAVYALQPAEWVREPVPVIPSRIAEELDGCTEVAGVEKSKLKKFFLKREVQSLADMDYPLRREFEHELKEVQHIKQAERYLLGYDRVKQYSIRQQMQTLAGRRQCQWKLEDKVLFIPYHSDQTLAMEFDSVRNRENMVWDFSLPCSKILKGQIFTTLNVMLEQFKDMRKREHRLSGLHYLYHFCAGAGIEDIEKMEPEQAEAFEAYLDRNTNSRSRKMQLLPSLNFCRRTVFLQGENIHWEANIWYLERMKLPDHRINPSGSFSSVSFMEITAEGNRRYVQEFMKYQIGVTGQSLSTIVTKFGSIKNFLVWLSERGLDASGCTEGQIDQYLQEMQEREIIAKTFNEYVTGLSQFYRFMAVRGYVERMPFHPEYYLKKIVRPHNDRSVPEETCTEMLGRLHLLPEHLRCMYLHLWCLGLRISEVCTLKGDAYERKDGDTWIKVYQTKMKTYKRVPIAEGLYKIMQVYIRRNRIGPDDYLFRNRNGVAYRTGTFRQQMKKFCEEQGIDGGEYLFKSHDYRHTVATFFYDNGASLQSVRDYLGHSYQEMTERYIDYMPKKIAKENDEYFRQPGHNLAAGLRKGGKRGKQAVLP